MFTLTSAHRTVALAVFILAASYSWSAAADDLVSFATGGYARGLRTKEMMNKIDTNSDGMISKAEWDAFQEKVFTTLDVHKRGSLSTEIFVSRVNERLVSFATGGYASGLRSKEMMRKIDANADGRISHDEFMAYQDKIFDMMDTSLTHKGTLSDVEMFANGGGNRH
jgi:Ca2+-binding EF-hand superfamily protein